MIDAAAHYGEQLLQLMERALGEIADPQKSLLEIVRDNKDANDSYSELRRMFFALKTYLDTDPTLRYVALVGSFSSGKTATINNLIEIAGTDAARPEDINPVDEKLTLCAHEKNETSLLATLLKSDWDADKFFHRVDSLSNIIFVDTPGGGDPTIRTDIVHNFLPICDTVIYCFNATNPLNSNDLPILRELNEVLQHTDFFYVYTRADNVFKKRDNEPLSQDNFDDGKARRQRDAFVARLNEALSHLPARVPELFFIGNTNQFGVDSLKRRILTPPGDVVSLGLQKLAFFRTRAIECIEIILKVVSELSVTVRDLVDRAEENHREYNAKFEIRTEEIKDFWRKAQNTLKETLARYKELEIQRIFSAIDTTAIERLASKDVKANDAIERFSDSKLQSLAREMGRAGEQEFDNWRRELQDRIRAGGLEGILNVQQQQLLAKSLKMLLSVIDQKNEFLGQARDQLAANFTTLFERFIAQIIRPCKEYRTEFDRAFRHSSAGELFNVERQLYDQCCREISSAIELYASLIDLYVSGINAAGTMLLIEKAHLAKDIDFLQREKIGELQKQETTVNLIGDIFGSGRTELREIEQKCSFFPGELKKWSAECEISADDAADLQIGATQARFIPDLAILVPIWEHAIQPLVTLFESWQEEQRAKIVLLVNRRHDEISADFEADKSRVTAAWKRRIRLVGALGAGVIVLVAVGYYRINPESIATVAVVAAAGEGLWTMLVWLFERLRSDNKDWVLRSRRKLFQSRSLKLADDIRNEALLPPDKLIEIQDDCRVRLNDALMQLIGAKAEEFKQSGEPLVLQIDTVRNAGAETVIAYRKEWEKAREIVESLYRETNDKMEKFKAVATAFKERTMDRTRALFGDRAATLDGYAALLRECARAMRELH